MVMLENRPVPAGQLEPGAGEARLEAIGGRRPNGLPTPGRCKGRRAEKQHPEVNLTPYPPGPRIEIALIMRW